MLLHGMPRCARVALAVCHTNMLTGSRFLPDVLRAVHRTDPLSVTITRSDSIGDNFNNAAAVQDASAVSSAWYAANKHTVVKYRQQLGIPPARLRKQY